MSAQTDPVTAADFDAYVDDQLDATRRIAVEAHLAASPELAACVMADLRTRDELRLALALPAASGSPVTSQAAQRLERGLKTGLFIKQIGRIAAVGLLFAAGWLANEVGSPLGVSQVVASAPAPAYVDDALRAHGTTLLRASMPSQAAAPYDPEEIRAATAIVMPELPADWHVSDVQVYPSRFGPSVELAARSDDLGTISLFAVRPGHFDVVKPKLAPGDTQSAAYFQVGEVAYAVVAATDIRRLETTANRLAQTLY